MEAQTERNKTEVMSVRCCIAGGGPAGIMLGYLLARAGISVAVLEKYPDFLRDFRGDTIHPSTMEVLNELGLLEKFLALKHNEMEQLEAHVGPNTVVMADFSHLPLKCPFIAFIPQSDFLNFIVAEAKKYPGFHVYMETEATEVINSGGVITGVKAKGPQGDIEFKAELLIGADGRHSTIREKAGLPLTETGVPFDVLWFSITRISGKKAQSLGYMNDGKIMIMLDRDEYWQCGYIIRKGDFEGIQARGLEKFKQDIVSLAPFTAESVKDIDSWDKVKLLTVAVNYLENWCKPGLLCIGDSAHAMSPVGGVGINIAIQDAVAAANILIPAFRAGKPELTHLQAAQRRRMWPVRLMQRLQVIIHNNVIYPVFNKQVNLNNPLPVRLMKMFPFLARVPGRVIGMGFRPEHVKNQNLQ